MPTYEVEFCAKRITDPYIRGSIRLGAADIAEAIKKVECAVMYTIKISEVREV